MVEVCGTTTGTTASTIANTKIFCIDTIQCQRM
jgi:hypothetical protein